MISIWRQTAPPSCCGAIYEVLDSNLWKLPAAAMQEIEKGNIPKQKAHDQAKPKSNPAENSFDCHTKEEGGGQVQ
jgi:hypothetical protein